MDIPPHTAAGSTNGGVSGAAAACRSPATGDPHDVPLAVHGQPRRHQRRQGWTSLPCVTRGVTSCGRYRQVAHLRRRRTRWRWRALDD